MLQAIQMRRPGDGGTVLVIAASAGAAQAAYRSKYPDGEVMVLPQPVVEIMVDASAIKDGLERGVLTMNDESGLLSTALPVVDAAPAGETGQELSESQVQEAMNAALKGHQAAPETPVESLKQDDVETATQDEPAAVE